MRVSKTTLQSVMAVLQDDMLAGRKGTDHEQIRKVSHKATRIARHFARMMGKADSHALASELSASRMMLPYNNRRNEQRRIE
jgi:hypothetical protein